MRRLNLLLVVLVGMTSRVHCDETSENFAFNRSASTISHYMFTESAVYHMEMDLAAADSILFSDASSLRTTDGIRTTTIAGKPTTNGYAEIIGETALFHYITGFRQLSKNKVAVVDNTNHCVRLVDRKTGRAATLAGTCAKPGYADGTQALFNWPWQIISDNRDDDMLLITDNRNHAVRHLNISSNSVTTFYKTPRHKSFDPIGITQDSKTGTLYLSVNDGIYTLSYQDKILSLLAGDPYNFGKVDGSFADVRFNGPQELLLIDDRKKCLVAGRLTHQVRVLDLETNTTTSLCTGNPRHTDGDMDTCSLYRLRSMLVDGDTLYLGAFQRIKKLTGGFIIDKLIRRINIRAEYDIQCDILDDPITKKSLQVTADNHANQIDGLICEDDCGAVPGSKASLSCVNNTLSITWQTNRTYKRDTTQIPAELYSKLTDRLSKLSQRFEVLQVVLLNRNPPVVQPVKTDIILSTSCQGQMMYVETTDSCQ